ncbi:MAG: polyprenyl diphosphate synthase [Rubricella sp.]
MSAGTTSAGTVRSVAIIMDGNGRWATRRGMPRIAGHKRGVDRVREIIEACPDLGVTHLTLYAFSTENWKRPITEVAGLMRLFRLYFRRESDELVRRGARVRFIGRRAGLPDDIVALIDDLEARSAPNTLLHIDVALNYGGRAELADAARRIAQEVASGTLDPADVDEDTLAARLYTAGTPEPDLVIRTSGEYRTSNFLPWQSAYSEFVFVDECWPDFTAERLAGVIAAAGRRERRYGAVAARVVT